MGHPVRATGTCRVCGRGFAWRAKWARNWHSVRYCSRACRRRGLRRIDVALESAIEALLAERPGRSIDPGEAARRADPAAWRDLVEPARMAARRLCHRGRVRLLQQGRPVEPDAMRGPVRIAAAR